MPLLTRWYLRTALVYFVAALGVGVLLSGRLALPLPPEIASLQPVYIHLLVVGWLTQLIFGVVWWMFPKHSREAPYRSPRVGWATYGLLNAGLLLRAAAEPLLALVPDGGWGVALAVSAVLQWLAGLGFVYTSWTRIKQR